MKTAFVFSGQGAQRAGMGKDIFEKSAAGRAVFEKADSVLPWKVSDVCFNGPEEKLTESRYCQVAIFVTSMACLEAFKEHFNGIRPVGCAGLSLGEYGALTCSGFFKFEDALRLVACRAELMDAAAKSAKGTMASIITNGLAVEEIAKVCRECSISIANYNSPAQTVISGAVDGVAKASEILKSMEGVRRIIPLNVAGAYHSSMMAAAGEKLSGVLDKTPSAEMSIPVAQNFTGGIPENREIKRNLVSQVAGSVRWVDCINTLSGLGAEGFIEFGPGSVLTGLIKKIDASKAAFNVSGFEDIEKITL